MLAGKAAFLPPSQSRGYPAGETMKNVAERRDGNPK